MGIGENVSGIFEGVLSDVGNRALSFGERVGGLLTQCSRLGAQLRRCVTGRLGRATHVWSRLRSDPVGEGVSIGTHSAAFLIGRLDHGPRPNIGFADQTIGLDIGARSALFGRAVCLGSGLRKGTRGLLTNLLTMDFGGAKRFLHLLLCLSTEELQLLRFAIVSGLHLLIVRFDRSPDLGFSLGSHARDPRMGLLQECGDVSRTRRNHLLGDTGQIAIALGVDRIAVGGDDFDGWKGRTRCSLGLMGHDWPGRTARDRSRHRC